MSAGFYHERRVLMGVCLAEDSGGDTPEECAARVSAGRVPWPAIAGNPPLDPKRPYLDLRRLNAESESGPSSS